MRSAPVIGPTGTIVFGSMGEDKVCAIRATNVTGLAASPWPMRGQNQAHLGRGWQAPFCLATVQSPADHGIWLVVSGAAGRNYTALGTSDFSDWTEDYFIVNRTGNQAQYVTNDWVPGYRFWTAYTTP